MASSEVILITSFPLMSFVAGIQAFVGIVTACGVFATKFTVEEKPAQELVSFTVVFLLDYRVISQSGLPTRLGIMLT